MDTYVLSRVCTVGLQPECKVRVARTDPDMPETPAQAWSDAGDHELVDACLAGHSDAFAVIVERHRRQVYQVCYRFVNNHEDASDLAQDAFVRAYKGLRGFNRQSALATWLYRIAVNVSLNKVAVKTPRIESMGAREYPDERRERPDAAMLRGERAAEVRAAIARLPNKQRATLILRVYHEMPHEQIAGILGSSVGAVKANFFHAMASLKKLLQKNSDTSCI
jgi:RNA polymerase sigma-70 factor (ECF subfamily)